MLKIFSPGAHSARAILRAIGGAAARWRDADFPPRVRVSAALEERTGYTTPVVEYALDRLFGELDEAMLAAAVTQELGSLEVLDRFVVQSSGVRARALPVGAVTIVSSETTIGVALIPALFALIAKCEVLVKDREDALIGGFFASLHEEEPELQRFAVARAWSGADRGEDVGLRDADAVVAFGRHETLAAIRARLRPEVRFVGYGHRAGLGYVARAALEDEGRAREAARGAARDLVLYDGEGCMSLHALFVERSGAIDPERFVQFLGEAVSELAIEFPQGRADPRLSALRSGAAFRAALGRGGVVLAPPGDATLVLDPPRSEPPPFLPRVLPVYGVDGPADCAGYVRAHQLPLEAFAVAPADDALLELAVQLGAVRATRLGDMQHAGPALRHGGRARVADFVRWVESEW